MQGSPLYLLKRSICCLEMKQGGVFLAPMPFCMGPEGASLLHCSLTRRRGAKEDGRMGREMVRKAVRGFVPLIVAAEVAMCLASLVLSYLEVKEGENKEGGRLPTAGVECPCKGVGVKTKYKKRGPTFQNTRAKSEGRTKARGGAPGVFEV